MGTRTTVIDEDLVREMTAEPSGDDLWIAGAESGWEAKPAGLCRGALCIPLPADPILPVTIAYDTELTQQLVGGTDEYLARIAERLTGTGVRVNRRSLVGHGVAATLIEAASEEGAALIVMATRGRGGLGRLGSVADKVMRGAPCPVLLDRRRRR